LLVAGNGSVCQHKQGQNTPNRKKKALEIGKGGSHYLSFYLSFFLSFFLSYLLSFFLSFFFLSFYFKGTVSRDFRLLVFFINQFPPSTRVYQYGHLEFFRKFAEIFAAQGAPPVSLKPVANGKNLQSEKFL
jgi:hypothetical protein